MTLHSNLFKGDPKLEACLVNNASHITEGALGNHVSKIQDALIELDDLNINDGELRARRYGPSTAAAVLAFKKKRHIVNLSYQTQEDNIVGKMTIAALDKEMFQKEHEGPGANTCQLIFACPCDVGQTRGLRLGFAIPAAAGIGQATPPSDDDLMKQAFAASRDTLRQVRFRLENLVIALDNEVFRGPDTLTADDHRVLDACGKWLNVSTVKTPQSRAAATAVIVRAIGLMDRNLAVKTSTGQDPKLRRVRKHLFAEVDGNTPNNGVRCGTDFFTFGGPNCRRDVISHEFFHFVGVSHGGGSLTGPTIRQNITTPGASLDSADNLAQLVAEIVTPLGVTDACARAGE